MGHPMNRKLLTVTLLLAFIGILALVILWFPWLRGDPGHSAYEVDQTLDTIATTNTAVSKLLTASAEARIATAEPH